MAPQKTLLSDPGLDIIQFVLRHNLTAIFEMECDDMTVAVNIEDIIGVGITELPSLLLPGSGHRFSVFSPEDVPTEMQKRA